MKKLFQKRMTDEQMELQCLKNAKKNWIFIVMALGISVIVELQILQWEYKYIIPQLLILIMAGCYNIFSDLRDGNISSSDGSDRRNMFWFYFGASAVTSIIVGLGFYIRTGSVKLTIVTFMLTLFFSRGLMFLLDLASFKIGKKISKTMTNYKV